MNVEGNLLQVDHSSQILRDKKVCEAIGPVDCALSAEVHVFSDSVLCVGNSAMSPKSNSI